MKKSLPEVVQMYEDRIASRIKSGDVTQEQVDKLGLVEKDSELYEFQSLQSRAFASGMISLYNANWLYQNLGGEAPDKEQFNKLSPAKRIVITQVMSELAERFIKLQREDKTKKRRK